MAGIKKNQRLATLSLITLLLPCGISACKKNTAASSSTPAPPAAGGTTVTIGTVNNSLGFSVTPCQTANGSVAAGGTGGTTSSGTCNSGRYFIHQLGNINEPCQINPSDVTNSAVQKTCVAEGDQLDLYYFGMDLAYNVPSSMCTYLWVNPYSYWNLQPGVGPTAISYEVDAAGDVQNLQVTTGGYIQNNAVVGGTTVAGNATTGGLAGTTPVCTYDYTSAQGPNCCEGSYLLNVSTWDSTTSSYVASPTVVQSWGGNYSGCMSGPATQTQPKTTRGYPEPVVTYVENIGENASYNIEGPIDALNGTFYNFWVSNYFNGNFLTGSNFFNINGTKFPNALGYQPAAGGEDGQPRVQPWYEFQCVDPSNQVIADLRVMIRSWRKQTDFANYQNGVLPESSADAVNYSYSQSTCATQPAPVTDPFGFPLPVDSMLDLFDIDQSVCYGHGALNMGFGPMLSGFPDYILQN